MLEDERGEDKEWIVKPVQKLRYLIQEDKAKGFGFKRLSLYTARKPFQKYHLSLLLQEKKDQVPY